jgi:hypothetical protein
MDVDDDEFGDSFDVDDDFLREVENAEQSLIASQAVNSAHVPQQTQQHLSSSRSRGAGFTFGAAARPPARLPPGHVLLRQQQQQQQEKQHEQPKQQVRLGLGLGRGQGQHVGQQQPSFTSAVVQQQQRSIAAATAGAVPVSVQVTDGTTTVHDGKKSAASATEDDTANKLATETEHQREAELAVQLLKVMCILVVPASFGVLRHQHFFL